MPTRVGLPDGPVTLVPLEELRQELQRQQARALSLQPEVTDLEARATDLLVQAGAIQARQRKRWSSQNLAAELTQADHLAKALSTVEQHLARPDGRSGPGWAVRGARPPSANRGELEAQRLDLVQGLRQVLVEIAERSPVQTVGDADRLRAEAAGLRRRSYELSNGSPRDLGPEPWLVEEVARREAAERANGFDALLTDGYLKAYGPQPVESPLDLAPGEVATVCVPSTLTRAGSGLLRQGRLVLTTARLAFVEAALSWEVPLSWVTRAHVDGDAMVVHLRQRRAPDCFQMASPAYVLRHMNWLLSSVMEVASRGRTSGAQRVSSFESSGEGPQQPGGVG